MISTDFYAKNMIRLLIASIVVSACFTGVAQAATQSEQAAACRADAFQFCASSIPNKKKITACMKKHYKSLSPACQEQFK